MVRQRARQTRRQLREELAARDAKLARVAAERDLDAATVRAVEHLFAERRARAARLDTASEAPSRHLHLVRDVQG
jgi:hypothetical protein